MLQAVASLLGEVDGFGVVEVRTTIVQEKFHHCPMTSMKTTLELKCTLKRNHLRTTNLTLSKFDAIEQKRHVVTTFLNFGKKVIDFSKTFEFSKTLWGFILFL